MQTTKILFALMFGVVGFWSFTQLGSSQARHLLITKTAAHVMDNGIIAITFSIENTGEAGRILSAASGQTKAEIRNPVQDASIVIPKGKSALSLENAHIFIPDADLDAEPGTLLPLVLTLDSDETVTAFIKVAEPGTTPGLHGTMLHGAMQIDMGTPPPNVAVTVRPTSDGYALSIDTENFVFDENAVDSEHVPGVGHGHLYVSGTKIGRVFGDTATIGALPKGRHLVEVTLNTNNHVTYMRDGTAVSASTVIEVD